jgi:hypothetical protein
MQAHSAFRQIHDRKSISSPAFQSTPRFREPDPVLSKPMPRLAPTPFQCSMPHPRRACAISAHFAPQHTPLSTVTPLHGATVPQWRVRASDDRPHAIDPNSEKEQPPTLHSATYRGGAWSMDSRIDDLVNRRPKETRASRNRPIDD